MSDKKQSAFTRRYANRDLVSFRNTAETQDNNLKTEVAELYSLYLNLEAYSKVTRGDLEVIKGSLSSYVTSIEGTINEIEVTTANSIVTIGLPNSITITEANLTNINFVTTTTNPTPVKGRLIWDDSHGTVVIGVNSNVHIPLGEASMINVRNSSASNILKGEIVYVSGSHSTGYLEVTKAQANAEATSAPTVGLAAEDIAINATGFVMTQGLLTGLTTTAYSAGQPIFLSESTAGGWRTSFPTAPNHGTFVGWIVKSAGGGTGSIFVKIHNYNELSELSDVYIPSTPSNNDVLQWTTANSRWENKSLSSAGIAAATHTHGNITNAGAIGSTSGLPIITNSGGVLTTGSFGTTSGTFCAGNDSRLSDARTPTTHTHTMADITDLREQKIFVECECNAAGEFSTISSNSGTNSFTTTGIDTTGGHYGILTSGTATTNNAVAGIGSADTTTATVFGTFKIETTSILMIPTLSTSTERFFIESGFTDNRTGVPVDGVLISYSDAQNSGKWIGLAYNNNTLTSVDLGITVTANTWYKLNSVINTNGSVDFYIDGTLRGSLAAGSAPTGSTRATALSHTIRKTVGTTARNLYIDYMNYIVWCSR